jgi:hypothetical protein
MSEVIIKRTGDPSERRKANKQLSNIGGLQEVYKSSKIKVEAAQDLLELEDSRLQKSREALAAKQLKLNEIEEIIDGDPLPEGAQPVARIQNRNMLKLVCILV